MHISRRSLLRHIGAGAAVTAARPSFAFAAAGPRSGPVRLNSNENAYGPSANVIAAIGDAALNAANRYPEREVAALQLKIAARHGVAPDQVVLGCGSGEILRLAADALATSKQVIVAAPTFELMTQYARRAGAAVVAVGLSHDYSHNLDAMLGRCNDRTGLVYICNPNNPTGTLTRRRDIEAFVRKLPSHVFVLIDEAYHHFVGGSSDYASFIDRPIDDRRVIVARSFSTIHGLAGLRIGYAIAAQATARLLAFGRFSENVNVVAAVAAAAALDDADHVRMSARRNADDRQEFFNQASARMVPCIDSQTNFVMLDTNRRAVDVAEQFKNNAVLVAPALSPMDGHIRVSLGLPGEMRAFWNVWDLLTGGHKMSM
jgi:histidinol-phosphate aminotransferase